MALLGPNGAGKTTTLLTLAGVVRRSAGARRCSARRSPAAGPTRSARRGAVLVPDDRAIFFDLTARENLRLGAGGKAGDAVDIVLDYFPSLKPRMSTARRACCPAASSRCSRSAGRSAAGRRS